MLKAVLIPTSEKGDRNKRDNKNDQEHGAASIKGEIKQSRTLDGQRNGQEEDMEKSRGLKHDSVKVKNMELSMELHGYITIFYNAETREHPPMLQTTFLSQLRDIVTGCRRFQITFKIHN